MTPYGALAVGVTGFRAYGGSHLWEYRPFATPSALPWDRRIFTNQRQTRRNDS